MPLIAVVIFAIDIMAITAIDACVRFFELRPNRKKYLIKYGPKLERRKAPLLLVFLFGYFWALCISSERNWRIHVWAMITFDTVIFLGFSSYLLYRLVS